jgi:hypothetical protein
MKEMRAGATSICSMTENCMWCRRDMEWMNMGKVEGAGMKLA